MLHHTCVLHQFTVEFKYRVVGQGGKASPLVGAGEAPESDTDTGYHGDTASCTVAGLEPSPW